MERFFLRRLPPRRARADAAHLRLPVHLRRPRAVDLGRQSADAAAPGLAHRLGRDRRPGLSGVSPLPDRGRPRHRRGAVVVPGANAARRDAARGRRRPGDRARAGNQRVAAFHRGVCARRLAGGARRRARRPAARRLSRRRLRGAAARLRGGHHRRPGQPQGRARRRPARRAARQLRQGVLSRSSRCSPSSCRWRSSSRCARPGCSGANEHARLVAIRSSGARLAGARCRSDSRPTRRASPRRC